LLQVERWSPGEQNLPSATFQFSSAATDGETIMNEVSLLQSLGQVSASQTAEIYRDFGRQSAGIKLVNNLPPRGFFEGWQLRGHE
jgi:hypothetical protein